MKKLFLVVLFISSITFLSGCSLNKQSYTDDKIIGSTGQEDQSSGIVSQAEELTGQENVFSGTVDQIQEYQSNTTEDSTILKKIREDGSFSYYTGEIVISGKYYQTVNQYETEGYIGDDLCFEVNENDKHLIPRNENDYRLEWFCFDDQGKANKLFNIDDKKIFPTIKCLDDTAYVTIEGNAKIKISNYIVNIGEGAFNDTAKLEKIISKDPYKIVCNKGPNRSRAAGY